MERFARIERLERLERLAPPPNPNRLFTLLRADLGFSSAPVGAACAGGAGAGGGAVGGCAGGGADIYLFY